MMFLDIYDFLLQFIYFHTQSKIVIRIYIIIKNFYSRISIKKKIFQDILRAMNNQKSLWPFRLSDHFIHILIINLET